MNEILEPETRKKIYSLLSVHPGLTLSRLAERLHMKEPPTERCLYYMEQTGEVISLHKNGLTRYYLQKEKTGTRERRSHELRQNIVTLLLRNPGLNLTTIAEHMGMSAQLAEYHVLYLERNDLVVGIKEKGAYYKRYYVTSSEVGAREKKIVALLRQENILRIVLLLLKKPNVQHKQLAELLAITPSTLSYHMNRLELYNIVEVTTYGREKGYRIHNKKEMTSIIRRCVTDIITEGFKDIWSDLNLK